MVVYCDRSRNIDATKEEIMDEQYEFCKLGEKLLKAVNGEYITNNYKIKEGKEFGKKLHEERVKWLKKKG